MAYHNDRVYDIATDSEWMGDESEVRDWPDLLGIEKVDAMFICTQTRYRDEAGLRRRVMILSADHYTDKAHDAAIKGGFSDVLCVPHRFLREGLLSRLPGIPKRAKVRVWFFYSPIDAAYLLGTQWTHDKVESGELTKRRCYKFASDYKGNPCGDYTLMGIHDISGLSNQGAEATAKSVGIDTLDKVESDRWDKGRMDVWLKEDPDSFMRYALWDIDWIAEYLVRFPALLNATRLTLGLSGDKTMLDIQATTGSLVTHTFVDWLELQCPGLADLIPLMAVASKGKRLKKDAGLYSVMSGYVGHLTDSCSVSVLAGNLTSARYNAVVLGGRCVNERPLFNRFEGLIADIDLQGCYGTTLATLVYPIGLPHVFGGMRDDTPVTLGDFMEREGAELVPGLWTIHLWGELSFDQSLMMSKRVKDSDLKKASLGMLEDDPDDDDPSKIPGVFGLFTRCLENAVLTHDLWEAIKAISTNAELEGWLNLKVISAAWYPRSKRVDEWEEFRVGIERAPGTLSAKGVRSTEVDERNLSWYGLPLGGYVTPLAEKRAAVKHTDKPLSDNLKLQINTLYGVIASPYFPIGNTVVANVITGRARLGDWMMAMALGIFQSVTDGGAYEPSNVRFLDKGASKFKAPGFGALFALSTERFNEIVGTSPYPGKQWVTKPSEGRRYGAMEWDGDLKSLDAAATRHINGFFGVYGLALPFKVEHKLENTAWVWVTLGKGDYALIPLGGGDRRYKLRGASQVKGLRRNPRFELLDALLDDRDIPLDFSMFYDSRKAVTPGSYLAMTTENRRMWYPGLYKVSEAEYKVKVSYLPMYSVDVYLKWDSSNKREEERRRLPEWFCQPSLLPSRGAALTGGTKRDRIS